MASLSPVSDSSSSAAQPAERQELPSPITSAAQRGFQYVCDSCQALRSQMKWCTRCQAALYCDVECQRAHWKTAHKAQCCESVIRLLGLQGRLEEVPMFPAKDAIVCEMRNEDGSLSPITAKEFQRLTGTHFCLWYPGKGLQIRREFLAATPAHFQNLGISHLLPRNAEHHIPEFDAIIRNPGLYLYLDRDPTKGFKLVAKHTIPKGTPLLFFTGRIQDPPLPVSQITKEQLDRRLEEIDPTFIGNLAHLLNDNPFPNTRNIWVNYLGTLAQVFIAQREIAPHEEVTLSYGMDTPLRWGRIQIEDSSYREIVQFVQAHKASLLLNDPFLRVRWTHLFLCPKLLSLLVLDGHLSATDIAGFRPFLRPQPSCQDLYDQCQKDVFPYFSRLHQQHPLIAEQVRQRIHTLGLGQLSVVVMCMQLDPDLPKNMAHYLLLWDMMDSLFLGMNGSLDGTYLGLLDQHKIELTPIPVDTLVAQYRSLPKLLQEGFVAFAHKMIEACASEIQGAEREFAAIAHKKILEFTRLMKQLRPR